MKKLITANDIRAAHARGEEEISVVLRASIITPEAREVYRKPGGAADGKSDEGEAVAGDGRDAAQL